MGTKKEEIASASHTMSGEKAKRKRADISFPGTLLRNGAVQRRRRYSMVNAIPEKEKTKKRMEQKNIGKIEEPFPA